MKRQSFKYIFFLNLLFIATCTVITFFPKKGNAENLPVSITTPIVNSSFEKQPFCDSAASAVILDGNSGAVLFEKNSKLRLPMASTTKIMTALTVITYCDPDKVITVDKSSALVEGSSIYLREGEKITVLDLLYGLMLDSGNDAASALAVGCFGSEKECVSKMNELCHSLGLVDTHFDNPHGLDSENHYTTAYELSRITLEALKNPLFRQIVSTKNYTACSENKRYFSNHNRLLRSYDGAIGVKTGYTSAAGRCLVSAATRENELYIAVTLNDKNDWNDHKSMLDFAFENFNCVEIAKKDDFVFYHKCQAYLSESDIFLTVRGNADFKLDYKFTVSQKDGAICEYYADGTKLGFFPLIKKQSDTPSEA